MADPLSIASAATGFLGLAGQLADGLVKLRGFYNTTRNAPKEVSRLINQLQDLQSLLEDVGKQLDRSDLAQSHGREALRRCLEQCEGVQSGFQKKMNDLDQKFKEHRLSQIQMVFKKAEIREMTEEIERCKSSLLIAQQNLDLELTGDVRSTIHTNHQQVLEKQIQLQQKM